MQTVIVKYPLPVPIEREVMLEEFELAEAQFRSLPGLIRKYFCYDEESHTGHSVYLWESEEQARAFFGPQFTKIMQEKFDSTPEWFFVDTLLVVDNERDTVTANPG
jgi:heme-degrading monooxygenase HmoA